MLVIVLTSDFQLHPLPSAPHFYCRCLDVTLHLICSKPNCLAHPSPSAPILPNPLFPVFYIQVASDRPTDTQGRASSCPSLTLPAQLLLVSSGLLVQGHFSILSPPLYLPLGHSGSQLTGAIATASEYLVYFEDC